VVRQFSFRIQHGVTQSAEVETPRLKPGGVQEPLEVVCSEKLKDHRLKPGGVLLLLLFPLLPPALARDALVNFLGKTLNYPGSEKRNVAINDC
jgi:hypothetical protein